MVNERIFLFTFYSNPKWSSPFKNDLICLDSLDLCLPGTWIFSHALILFHCFFLCGYFKQWETNSCVLVCLSKFDNNRFG